MAVRQDCPLCGRKANEGHVDKGLGDDTFTAFETVVCGALGFCIGGPVGAAIGATGGNKAAKWLTKRIQTTKDGYVWYRFNCMNPNCKHTWISKIKE